MAIDRTISSIGVDSGADNGKVPVYNNTTKVFDMTTPGGGGVWSQLANVTLGGTNTVISSGTITAKKFLRITIYGLKSTSLTLSLRFNNDSTAAHYTYSYSKNGGADNRTTNDALIINESASTISIVALTVINVATQRKIITGTSAIESVRYENSGYWDNTADQITLVDVYGGGNNFSAGAQLIVEGAD